MRMNTFDPFIEITSSSELLFTLLPLTRRGFVRSLDYPLEIKFTNWASHLPFQKDHRMSSIVKDEKKIATTPQKAQDEASRMYVSRIEDFAFFAILQQRCPKPKNMDKPRKTRVVRRKTGEPIRMAVFLRRVWVGSSI